MPEDPTRPAATDDPLEAIVAALTEGGPRTAGQLADYMGIPYSTLTPRLRRLEDAGRTERATNPDTRQMIWQLAATPTSTSAAGIEVHDDPITQTGDADDATEIVNGRSTDQAAAVADRVEPEPAAQAEAAPTDPAGPAPAAEQPGHAPDSGSSGVGDQPTVDAAANEPATVSAADADLSGQSAAEQKARRRKGTVAAEILAIARARPDTGYKTGELAKVTGISQGAIANAAHKLCGSGELLLVCETPATFQAA